MDWELGGKATSVGWNPGAPPVGSRVAGSILTAPHSAVTWDPSPEAVMQSVIAGPGALAFYVQPA